MFLDELNSMSSETALTISRIWRIRTEYRTLWDASKLSLFYQILELLHDFHQIHLLGPLPQIASCYLVYDLMGAYRKDETRPDLSLR